MCRLLLLIIKTPTVASKGSKEHRIYGLFVYLCEARPSEYSCMRACINTEVNAYLFIYLIYTHLSIIYPVDMLV